MNLLLYLTSKSYRTHIEAVKLLKLAHKREIEYQIMRELKYANEAGQKQDN